MGETSPEVAAEPIEPASFFLPPPQDPTSPPHTTPSSQPETTPDPDPWNRLLLRQNAIWFCRLRWIVVATLGTAGLLGLFPSLMQPLGLAIPPVVPLASASILALLNGLFVKTIPAADNPGATRNAKLILWLQIACDLLVLTAVVHWLNRDLPCAPFMYLFHIILACIVFTPTESFTVLGMAATFLLISLLATSQEWLPQMSVLLPANPATPSLHANSVHLGYRTGFTFLIWGVIWYLVSWLARKLQQHEHQLALTNIQLKASGEERSAHMLQTTHQLKAPFAAIHAQTQLLLGNYCGTLPPKAHQVVETIAARSMALSRQIQQMLQLANLRSQGQSTPQRKPLDLAELTTQTIHRIEPSARHRNITLSTQIEPSQLEAVEDHLTMLVDNLIVNAVTYSHPNSSVEIHCHPSPHHTVTLTVRDHGIGIPKEKLPRIFDDYYRTEEAAQHNRTSTGLGLAVVRQVAHAANATVHVESAPGWGTRFTVQLPTRQTKANPSPRKQRK
jgi:signal transduction histidine kinase